VRRGVSAAVGLRRMLRDLPGTTTVAVALLHSFAVEHRIRTTQLADAGDCADAESFLGLFFFTTPEASTFLSKLANRIRRRLTEQRYTPQQYAHLGELHQHLEAVTVVFPQLVAFATMAELTGHGATHFASAVAAARLRQLASVRAGVTDPLLADEDPAGSCTTPAAELPPPLRFAEATVAQVIRMCRRDRNLLTDLASMVRLPTSMDA